jgi:hypothetical protein
LRAVYILRKPFSVSTVALNVQKHGAGALNIKDTRIGDGSDKDAGGCKGENALHGGGIKARAPVDFTVGRWPANIILNQNDALPPIYRKLFKVVGE